MRNVTGDYVTDENFFDRKRDVEECWERLESDNVLLLAPRRVGKTSLLHELKRTAGSSGYRAVYLSVEGVKDELGFLSRMMESVNRLGGEVERLIARLLARTGKIQKLFKRIEQVGIVKLSPEEKASWRDAGEDLIKELAGLDGKWLFLIDELPLFVLDLVRADPQGDRARDFLSWFRELRQRESYHGKLRFLLSGSIGLDTIAARYRFGDTINDLAVRRLGEFDPGTAAAMLAELGKNSGIEITSAVADHAIERIGWLIPYYLQLWFQAFRARAKGLGREPAVGEAEQAFEDLLSAGRISAFDYWRQRLTLELGPVDGGHAIELLCAIARDPDGSEPSTLAGILTPRIGDPTERSETYRFLMNALETDGYVAVSNGRFRFVSSLLREFWLRRVVAQP